MDAVLLEWRQHEIDEVGFHHGSQVCVFENTKLAIPYSLLPSIAEEAWAAFLKAKAGEASNMAAASLALVIVDGNHYTAWNARKLYLKDVNDPAALYEEIRVSAAILRKHPKSAVGWAHR